MVTTDDVLKAAETVVDGWYPQGRIDWQEFLDRLERLVDVDLGDSLDSPLIRKVKKHVRDYRNAG